MIECKLPGSSRARCDCGNVMGGKSNVMRTIYTVFQSRRWSFCLKLRNMLPGDVTAMGRIILGVPLYIEKEYIKKVYILYYIILY